VSALPATSSRADALSTDQTSWSITGRVAVLAGRMEAVRLCRNPIVIAGLVCSAALIWWNSRGAVPQWWVWDVEIGTCLLTAAATLLVAAHFAAGRVKRDGATALYASLPTTQPVRLAAHLLGLVGPLAFTFLVALAGSAWLQALGPVGSPRPAVLAQGLLLVALGGTLGVALGCYAPHPISGIVFLTVLGAAEGDVLLPSGAPAALPGGTQWLLPWAQPVVLHWLPAATSLIPPTAHLVWLAALVALAATIAVLRFAGRRRLNRSTALVALVLAGSLVAAAWSGWTQTRPLGPKAENELLYMAIHPNQAERCLLRQQVRYCAYPGFARDLPRWAIVVNGVLGKLPVHARRGLTVRQVVDVDFYAPPLTVGFQPTTRAQELRQFQLAADLGNFVNAETTDPHLVMETSIPPVYVDVNWGAGAAAAAYQLGLATQVAWWVTGLPTTWRTVAFSSSGGAVGQALVSCVPYRQAREAIALWLAAEATPQTKQPLLAQLQAFGAVRVSGVWIAIHTGITGAGYQPAIQFTGQGAALAQAMLALPVNRVDTVLTRQWSRWLSPSATDSQLARALGVRLPAGPRPQLTTVTVGQPSDPVCR
jgi:hypothetical protein